MKKSKKNPAPAVPLSEVLELLPKTAGVSKDVLSRIAAFETRKSILRASRRLRKLFPKATIEIVYPLGETRRVVAEAEAILLVLDRDFVEVVARAGAKVLARRTVGVRGEEAGA